PTPLIATLFPYTTLFRSRECLRGARFGGLSGEVRNGEADRRTNRCGARYWCESLPCRDKARGQRNGFEWGSRLGSYGSSFFAGGRARWCLRSCTRDSFRRHALPQGHRCEREPLIDCGILISRVLVSRDGSPLKLLRLALRHSAL